MRPAERRPTRDRPPAHDGAERSADDHFDPRPLTPRAALAAASLFLRRNLKRVGLAGALIAALAFGGASFYFNKYAATAMLALDPRPANVVPAGGVLAGIGPDTTAMDSLPLIAKSDSFLAALADKLDLEHVEEFAPWWPTPGQARAIAIAKLASRLTIARRGATYVIEATATAKSPELAAKIANAAAKLIVDGQSGLRSGAAQKAADDIAARLAEVGAKANRAEEAAAELKAKLKITDAGLGTTLLEKRVSELNLQRVLASAKTGEAKARYEQLRKASTGAVGLPAPGVQSNLIDSLRVDYERLSRQAADQASALGPRHPGIGSLRAQLADMRRQIDAELARLTAGARADFLAAEQNEAALARSLKETQSESGDLGPQMVKLSELDREAKAQGSVYELLLARQKELAETKNLEPADLRIVSPAEPPTKTWPGTNMLAPLCLAAGLLGGLAWALARELSRLTLRTPKQAEKAVGVEVAGLVPDLVPPPQARGRAVDLPDVAPWLADLGASIAQLRQGGAGALALVSSAGRGEGRSTIAAGLASALAEAGERVLLIEADAPDEPDRGFGLVDALARGEDLRRAILEDAAGYSRLPYGNAHDGAGALLGGLTMQAALRLCRQWFDVVVVDGPPAFENGVPRFLAGQADVTVFAAQWNETRQGEVNDALDRLAPSRAALVLNRVDVPAFAGYDPAQSRRLANLAA